MGLSITAARDEAIRLLGKDFLSVEVTCSLGSGWLPRNRCYVHAYSRVESGAGETWEEALEEMRRLLDERGAR